MTKLAIDFPLVLEALGVTPKEKVERVWRIKTYEALKAYLDSDELNLKALAIAGNLLHKKTRLSITNNLRYSFRQKIALVPLIPNPFISKSNDYI